jgi:hypothetical protein
MRDALNTLRVAKWLRPPDAWLGSLPRILEERYFPFDPTFHHPPLPAFTSKTENLPVSLE